jgi:Ca2+-binding EF-hand superfamily protein
LKNLYCAHAEIGRGLSINSFRKFMNSIFNIEGHPFTDDFFLYFDTNHDGLIDFYEMVVGMNIIEKGTFEEKCNFAYGMYDITEADVLDTQSIREVLRRTYVT